VAPYQPFLSHLLQCLIPEAYCDIPYRPEVFGAAVDRLEYSGLKKVSSINDFVSVVDSAQDLSLDGVYHYIIDSRSRSNSVAALHVSQIVGYDTSPSTSDPPYELARILEKNLAYAEKHGIIVPAAPAASDSLLSMKSWLLFRDSINVTDLGTYCTYGTVVVNVAAGTVILSPTTIIELPDYAAIQFRVGGQTYKLIIGTLGSSQQVIIRRQGTATVGWTGFAFWPGDRYGTGADARIEILSPFHYENLIRPFRFYQITKGGKMVK